MMGRRDDCDRTKLKLWVANERYGQWQEAARHAGAGSLAAWVRGVLDREAAVQMAKQRNPWLEARQGELGRDAVRRSKTGATKEKPVRGTTIPGQLAAPAPAIDDTDLGV